MSVQSEITRISGKVTEQTALIEEIGTILDNKMSPEANITYNQSTKQITILTSVNIYPDAESIMYNGTRYVIPANSYAVTLTAPNATHGFELNTNGYYESTNKGVQNSASVCIVNLNIVETCTIKFSCINYAEKNYDYGILGKLNEPLSLDNTSDTNYAISFKGASSLAERVYNYSNVPIGAHTIYVKFRKDGSGDNYNDSLQFKISFL